MSKLLNNFANKPSVKKITLTKLASAYRINIIVDEDPHIIFSLMELQEVVTNGQNNKVIFTYNSEDTGESVWEI